MYPSYRKLYFLHPSARPRLADGFVLFCMVWHLCMAFIAFIVFIVFIVDVCCGIFIVFIVFILIIIFDIILVQWECVIFDQLPPLTPAAPLFSCSLLDL